MTDDLWDALHIDSPPRRTVLEARATNHVEDVTERRKPSSFVLSFGTEQ